MALSERERMGSGGLRGLQILRSGASSARGGFDSHAFPPCFARGRRPARAGWVGVALRALIAVLLAATLAAESRAQARPDSTTIARPAPVSRDTMVVLLGRVRPTGSGAASDTTRRRVFTAADSARYAADRARRAPPAAPKGFDQPKWVMLRSLVVPGWGQAYNGAWWKAAGVALTEGYLIARIVDDSRALNRLQRDVELTTDAAREQMLSDEYIARSDRFVGRQWMLGAVVAYALTDAYIDAHFRNFRIEFEHDPALPAGDTDAAGLRVSWQEKF